MITSSWGLQPGDQERASGDQNPRESPNTACVWTLLSRTVHLLTSFGQGPIPGRGSELGKNEFWHTAVSFTRSAFWNFPETWLFLPQGDFEESPLLRKRYDGRQMLLGDFMFIADIYSWVLTTPALTAFRFLCLFPLSAHYTYTLRMNTANLAFPLNCLFAKVNNLMITWDNYY